MVAPTSVIPACPEGRQEAETGESEALRPAVLVYTVEKQKESDLKYGGKWRPTAVILCSPQDIHVLALMHKYIYICVTHTHKT